MIALFVYVPVIYTTFIISSGGCWEGGGAVTLKSGSVIPEIDLDYMKAAFTGSIIGRGK